MDKSTQNRIHPAFAYWNAIPSGTDFSIALLKNGSIGEASLETIEQMIDPNTDLSHCILTYLATEQSEHIPALRGLPRAFTVYFESEHFIQGLSHNVLLKRLDTGEARTAFLSATGPVNASDEKRTDPVCGYHVVYN